MLFYNHFPEHIPDPIRAAVLSEEGGKWFEVLEDSRRSASGKYIFVQQNGRIYVSKVRRGMNGSAVGHIDLARGTPVAYAGEVFFSGRKKRGILRFWTNESGHYLPAPEFARQAGLPLNLFRAIDT